MFLMPPRTRPWLGLGAKRLLASSLPGGTSTATIDASRISCSDGRHGEGGRGMLGAG
jgi:hypothetical protein